MTGHDISCNATIHTGDATHANGRFLMDLTLTGAQGMVELKLAVDAEGVAAIMPDLVIHNDAGDVTGFRFGPGQIPRRHLTIHIDPEPSTDPPEGLPR